MNRARDNIIATIHVSMLKRMIQWLWDTRYVEVAIMQKLSFVTNCFIQQIILEAINFTENFDFIADNP